MDPKKKTLLITLIVVLILGVSLYSFFAGNYNKFVKMDVAIKAAWSQVENQLQRRYDLIPNLVETVKGYAKQEKDVLVEVTNARAKVGGAGTIPDKIAANNQLTSALSRLMVVVEKYPDLKSNQNFMKLQDELAGTENRIAVERMRYNEWRRGARPTTRPGRNTPRIRCRGPNFPRRRLARVPGRPVQRHDRPLQPGASGNPMYQGESNGPPRGYAELLPAMIRSWRAGFGQGACRSILLSSPTLAASMR